MNWLEVSIGIIFSYMYHNRTDKRCSPYHSVACSDDSIYFDRILCDAICIADNRKNIPRWMIMIRQKW